MNSVGGELVPAGASVVTAMEGLGSRGWLVILSGAKDRFKNPSLRSGRPRDQLPVPVSGFRDSAGSAFSEVLADSAALTASSTTAWPAAASPFITLAALSMIPIVPLIA